MYDYLIVGAGLYGVTCARLLTNKGYKVCIIDKRNKIAGNIYSERINNIDVHKYGPHIFHTDYDVVWDFVNKYTKFNNFRLNTIAYDGEKIYHLPFNMNTFYEIFGTETPYEAKEIISQEIKDSGLENKTPSNLEEQAIKMVGTTIYNKLIKYYTEKQWNKNCNELDPSIITRLPLRFNYDNNYFNDRYQGIPTEGYTKFVENILRGNDNENEITDIILNENYLDNIGGWNNKAKYVIYCGEIDRLFNYCYGQLEWRSLKFNEYWTNDKRVSQGNAIKNMVMSKDICPATRYIEHHWFNPINKEYNNICITEEIPQDWDINKEPYYPINNNKNSELYNKYLELLKSKYPNIILGGRLGKYKYYDMDDTIYEAMNYCSSL